MFSAPIPDNDQERVATLRSYAILDTPREQAYEDVTALATFICETPYSTITFVDKDRQWFKSEVGFGTNETGRSDGFCACAILRPETLVVEDTLRDPRFARNPFVLGGPQIRFYAGAPIIAPNGHVLGTVCVFDSKPRHLSIKQIKALEALARQVQGLLHQRDDIARLEDALATSEAAERHLGQLAAIVDSSDDAILSKDLDGIITSWNAAASRILGYTAEEIIGQSILRLIPEDFQSDEPLIIAKIRAGERIEHFETVRLTKDGRRIDVALTISPIKNAQGRIIGASKILRDISGRKRIEQSLLQSEKLAAVGRVASSMAHEINNPLEAVTNLLYLCRQNAVNPDVKGWLDDAEVELRRISIIANQTLRFHRQSTKPQPASCLNLFSSTLSLYESKLKNSRIFVEKRKRANELVSCYEGDVRQVISNLITNAIDAMPNGGRLLIRSREATEWKTGRRGLALTVADTGIGISPEAQERMFDAFWTTKGIGGNGLGLWISADIMNRHQGTIAIRSSQAQEHSGTVVVLFLPFKMN